MKKKLLLSLWLVLPVVLLAYHYGPGRDGVARDQVASLLAKSRSAEASGNWEAAVGSYTDALALLPGTDTGARARIRLAQAQARIHIGELPEAMQDFESLLDDVTAEQGEGPLAQEVRESLASSQYYAAWLMRLEGADRQEWTIPVDQARQNYRMLAEASGKAGDGRLTNHEKNLEASIRLAQMDLSVLQGLPLPKQCSGCKNCSQKCRSQRESKKKREDKPPKDARSAGQNQRPATGGS